VIVLDASAVVEWLLRRPAAPRIDERIADPNVVLHAPSYLPVEVTAAFRGLVIGGHMSPGRGRQALADLLATEITPHDPAP
jgi:hypothetical protein